MMHSNLSAWHYLFATVTAVLASYFIFSHYAIDARYSFAPILVLALLYAAMNFTRQLQGRSVFRVHVPNDLSSLFKRALTRYLVWLAILYGGFALLRLTQSYMTGNFSANVRFYDELIHVYLYLGWPYFCITLLCKASRVEDFYDPVVRLLLMLKQPVTRALRGDNLRAVVRVFRNRYNRKVLLNFLMRAYFLPIMLVQIFQYLPQAVQLHTAVFTGHHLMAILYWLVAMLWLFDITNVALAYLLESRWLENRTRSIDMTLTGWAVCLFCYAPLNSITGALLPFGPNLASGDINALIFPSSAFLIGLKVAEIVLLTLHIFADVSLGPAVANITFKQLQKRGPYALVRHPGTTTKLLLWLVMSSGYSGFWSTSFILGFFGWAALYIARALTEERHLSQYAVYREYQQQVRYRFIPGII